MLRFLWDPANAITMLGLAFAIVGLNAVIAGDLDRGVAAVLWALLADHLDGIVALRTKNRLPDADRIGKCLDSFTDLVSDAVFPALVAIHLNGASILSLTIAITLVGAGALRLSYFNTFGLSEDGKFVGLPLSYDVPLLAALFLLRPEFSDPTFRTLVTGTLAILAILHVLPVRIPRLTGSHLALMAGFAVIASACLAMRGVS